MNAVGLVFALVMAVLFNAAPDVSLAAFCLIVLGLFALAFVGEFIITPIRERRK